MPKSASLVAFALTPAPRAFWSFRTLPPLPTRIPASPAAFARILARLVPSPRLSTSSDKLASSIDVHRVDRNRAPSNRGPICLAICLFHYRIYNATLLFKHGGPTEAEPPSLRTRSSLTPALEHEADCSDYRTAKHHGTDDNRREVAGSRKRRTLLSRVLSRAGLTRLVALL